MVEQTTQDSGPIESQGAAPAAPAPVSAPSSAAPPPTPTAALAAPAPEAPAPEPTTALQAEASDKESLLAILREKDDAPATDEKVAAPTADTNAEAEADPGVGAKDEDADDGDDADEAEPLTAEERAEAGSKVARKVSRLLRNVKRLKPDAVAYRNITRFMAENKLTGDEAAKGFEVMALLKAEDPRALDALRPYIDRLNLASGDVLPADLHSKVEQGYMDQESAREMAALRHARERSERAQQEQHLDQQNYRAEQHRTGISSALNEWEARQAANPDYAAVKTAVFDYAKASFKANAPATAAEAVTRIEGFFNQLRQRPGAGNGVSRPVQPVRPGPSSAHSPSSLPAREPQTLEESIRMTLQRRGAA